MDKSPRKDFDIGFVFDDFAKEILRFTFPIGKRTSTIRVAWCELYLERTLELDTDFIINGRMSLCWPKSSSKCLTKDSRAYD